MNSWFSSSLPSDPYLMTTLIISAERRASPAGRENTETFVKIKNFDKQ
jgi:hypothetical protein